MFVDGVFMVMIKLQEGSERECSQGLSFQAPPTHAAYEAAVQGLWDS